MLAVPLGACEEVLDCDGIFQASKGWGRGGEGWRRSQAALTARAGLQGASKSSSLKLRIRPHLEDRWAGSSFPSSPPRGPRFRVGCEAALKRHSGPRTPTGLLPGEQKYALKLEFYANT